MIELFALIDSTWTLIASGTLGEIVEAGRAFEDTYFAEHGEYPILCEAN